MKGLLEKFPIAKELEESMKALEEATERHKTIVKKVQSSCQHKEVLEVDDCVSYANPARVCCHCGLKEASKSAWGCSSLDILKDPDVIIPVSRNQLNKRAITCT